MATFLTNAKMSPELAARIDASVRGRRSKGGAASSARVTAIVRLVLFAGIVSGVTSLVSWRRGEGKRIERDRAALLDALHARGVVYAPDYAINAGGLVNVHAEHHGHASGKGYDEKASREKVLAIHDTILEIVERAKATNVPSYRVADLIVEERLAKVPATSSV